MSNTNKSKHSSELNTPPWKEPRVLLLVAVAVVAVGSFWLYSLRGGDDSSGGAVRHGGVVEEFETDQDESAKHGSDSDGVDGQSGDDSEYPLVSHKVKRVVDGDTIVIDNGERVRYIGMDTPETKKPNTPIQCYGPEASQYNTELVGGKTVKLQRDISNRDKYGRLLRYVYLPDGTFVNKELVQKGYATVLTIPPDTAKASELKSAQAGAKADGVGLWSACGDDSGDVSKANPEASSPDDGCYTGAQAKDHYGENHCVTYTVSDPYMSSKGTVFLNEKRQYDDGFTAVIFADGPSCGGAVSKYGYKNISVSGVIKKYQGAPEIIVNSCSQIKIAN